MFLEIIIIILLGCLAGVITGLTPGLHINLVAIILFSLSPFLIQYTNVIVIASFIIAMSITHTFTDFISATYLGAPSDDTALAVLPAHRLLLKGQAHEAIRLTVIGSLLCLIITIMLFPLLIIIVPFIFSNLKTYIAWILIIVIIFMIMKEEGTDKKFWAFIVVILSGILGLVVFSLPNLKEPLLPMLSGLFGISILILSLNKRAILPIQRITEMVKVKTINIIKAVMSSIFSGALVSIFPGLGPAQAAVLAEQVAGKTSRLDNNYLIIIGGVNTVSMILSLITLFIIQKARNGSIIVVQQLLNNIKIDTLLLFLSVSFIAGGIATFLTLYMSRIFSKIINKIDYSILSTSIIVLITSLVLYFSGFVGFLILLIATFIGLIPNIINVKRSNAMACLLIPLIVGNM